MGETEILSIMGRECADTTVEGGIERGRGRRRGGSGEGRRRRVEMRLLERGGHQSATLGDPTSQNRDCQAAERRRTMGRGLTVMFPQSSQSRAKR